MRAAVRVVFGDRAGAVGDLDRLTRLHPLRERLWAVRALALARAGRQGDALAALREGRRRLSDELGIDPARTCVPSRRPCCARTSAGPPSSALRPPPIPHPPPKSAITPPHERLCETWKVPLVARWLRDQRDRHGI